MTHTALKMARDALADLHLNVSEAMRTGGWVPTPLHQSFWQSMVEAANAIAAIDALQSTHPADASIVGAQIDMRDKLPTGGSPEHMLQDQSRELSRWLSTQPGARLHATEAAAAILRDSVHSAGPAPTRADLTAALQFYAGGGHFNLSDQDAWDTVSGEPQNWWCDEAGTATVEDGSLAKMALAGEMNAAHFAALERGDDVCIEPSDAGTAPTAPAPAQAKPVVPDAGKWEGAEEWMPLAWELCADECGEEACTELVWEGGPIPEPWGDRWLKYEGEAKRLIALVRKCLAESMPTPPAAAAPLAQPLTEARILEMAAEAETPAWGEWYTDEDALFKFARAVEAHKGQP